MQAKSNVLLIGPDPDTREAGGVITHMRTLISLGAFRTADLFDVGNIQGAAGAHRITAAQSVLRRLFRLRKQINVNRYRHVLINASITDTSIGKLLLTLAALPQDVVQTIQVFFHGGRFEHTRLFSKTPARQAAEQLLGRADCAYFLSGPQRRGYEALFPGLAAEYFQNYSSASSIVQRSESHGGPLRLLFVGRVTRSKGVFELVAAVHDVVRERYDCKLTIVGDGPDMVDLRQATAPLSAHVEFAGYLDGEALMGQYKTADVFVLPSYHEGMPYTMIEAMQAGLPIIATPVGALERFVIDRETGLRVASGDVASLAAAIRMLHSDPSLRDRIAANNHRIFRRQLSRLAAEEYYYELLDDE